MPVSYTHLPSFLIVIRTNQTVRYHFIGDDIAVNHIVDDTGGQRNNDQTYDDRNQPFPVQGSEKAADSNRDNTKTCLLYTSSLTHLAISATPLP